MRRLFLSAGVLLLSAPLFLLAGAALTPGHTPLWLLPSAVGILLALAVRALPKRARIPCALLGMALAAGFAALLGRALNAGDWVVMPALLAAGAVAAHLLLLSVPWGELTATPWYIGIVLYFFARLVGALGALDTLTAPLRVCALLYVVFLCFALSSQSLLEGMGGGRGPSRLMLLRNALAAGGMAALFLILTHLDAVGRLFRRAFDGVMGLIVRIIEWLDSLFVTAPAAGGGGGGMDLEGLISAPAEPSGLVRFLEKAAYVLGAVLAVVAAALLLWLAFRAVKRGVLALLAYLRKYAGAVSDAYEDTVESLVDWGEMKRAFSLRRAKSRKKAEKPLPWERLTPRQRVRRSYRDYLRRHPDLPAPRTARQALADPRLADIYEAARYSTREITPAEAEESRGMR